MPLQKKCHIEKEKGHLENYIRSHQASLIDLKLPTCENQHQTATPPPETTKKHNVLDEEFESAVKVQNMTTYMSSLYV